MTNIEAFRNLVNNSLLPDPELLKLVDAIEKEIESKASRIESLEEEVSDLEKELELEPEWDTVELGLDTLDYKFEKNNLKIKLQFEHWVNLVKAQNGAGVQMPQLLSC